MLPSLLRLPLGDLVLHLAGYGFPAVCGILAGLIPALRRAREAGLPRRAFLAVVLVALIGGFAGAKVAAWLQTGAWSGRVLYGGFLGGLAALGLAARALRLPPVATADALVPPALLAAAFGRLGCLFAGCCYGIPAAEGLAYPRGSLAWAAHVRGGLIPSAAVESLPTLPMPLLESGVLFLAAVLTSRLGAQAVGSGRVLAVAGLFYSGWRFLAEFGRGDHGPYLGAFLTFSQWVSVCVFVASLRGLSSPIRASAPAPPAEPFRWAAAAQVAALLLLASLGSGSVGCSSSKREEVQEKRKEIHANVRDKAKAYYRRAKEEFKEDCADDCARICCEITCAFACRDDQDEEEEDAGPHYVHPEGPVASNAFRIPVIRPGERVEIEVDLHGRLNFRTNYALRLSAVVDALAHEPEAVPYRLSLKTLELSLGDLRCASTGEAELRLDANGVLSLGAGTLGDDVLGVLKAVEHLAPGLVRLPSTVVAAPPWREILARELAAGDQVHGDATVSWNGTKRVLELRAWVTERGDGTRRIQWLVR